MNNKNFKRLNFVAVLIGDEVHVINTKKDIVKENIICKEAVMAYDSSVITKAEAVKRCTKQIKEQVIAEQEAGGNSLPWKFDVAGGDSVVGIYDMRKVPNRIKLRIAKVLKTIALNIEATCREGNINLEKLNKE